MPTTFTWVGSTTDPTTASNWSGGSVGAIPGAGDTAIFANSQPCQWTISSIGTIQIKDSYTGILTIATDVAITGLDIQAEGQLDASSASILTFSGTPPYNSGKTHIVYGYSTDNSPFRTTSARSNFTFKMNGTSTITYDSGIYPHILLTNGNHTPDYATVSGTRTNQIKYLSLTVNSGAGFAPASATPSANDRLRKWISETAAQTQFAISSGVASFDGGYAEWTFQATSSGFVIPTSGVTTYNQCKFTFDKMVIDASVGGVGKFAVVAAATRLTLTDFTVNVGASVKGTSSSTGCAILLVNKPTIHGTWGFFAVADGYYVFPKIGETLGYTNGGTGLTSLGTANQVLAVNAGATALEFQTVSGGGGSGTVDVVSNVATNTILGRVSSGSGDSEELTQSQVLAFLGNVEAGADVTDATNVQAAGALMDSELTDLAGVKGVTISTLQSKPSEGAFVNGDKTKLDTIATNADVTDTANVTAAGALMDSEVTNLAQVKAFNSADYATAAQGAKADTALQPGTALAPGDPVSALANDAGYLDSATTPTSIYGRWELTNAIDGLAEATDNTLPVDDSSGFTRTGTLTGFSGGTFTANAATAGTYYVNARLHFGDSTTGTSIAETSGNKYTLQILIFHGLTMEGFGRIQKNGFWVDDHFETSTIVTLADGDTLQIKHKVVDHAASGTKYRIKNGGGNPANAVIMVKLA